MVSISSIAQSGMQAAQRRLDASAHNVANQNTAAFRRHEVQQQESKAGGVQAQTVRAEQGVSLEREMVEQISTSYAYLANLKVLTTADRMQGSLLNEKA